MGSIIHMLIKRQAKKHFKGKFKTLGDFCGSKKENIRYCVNEHEKFISNVK